MYRVFPVFPLILVFLLSLTYVNAQTNLLLNTYADADSNNWRAYKQAAVENFNGSKVFAVRNGGYFLQDVVLSPDDIGKFALLIGRGASERINVDGAITGLPYLYGYMMDAGSPNGGTIFQYLQADRMRCNARIENEWATMYGIFEVPKKTEKIRFFLNQAERRGVPQNGSAARFDNLGLYLFPTEGDALKFVESYK